MKLFHLVRRAEWEAAVHANSYRPSSLHSEGFIHLSLERQLLRSAEKYFAGRDDVLALELDAERLGAPVRMDRVEIADDSFPHLYGALKVDAVVAVHALRRGSDGRFVMPSGL